MRLRHHYSTSCYYHTAIPLINLAQVSFISLGAVYGASKAVDAFKLFISENEIESPS